MVTDREVVIGSGASKVRIVGKPFEYEASWARFLGTTHIQTQARHPGCGLVSFPR